MSHNNCESQYRLNYFNSESLMNYFKVAKKKLRNWFMLVCNYQPNVLHITSDSRPYVAGDPCSMCKSDNEDETVYTCEEKLCSATKV